MKRYRAMELKPGYGIVPAYAMDIIGSIGFGVQIGDGRYFVTCYHCLSPNLEDPWDYPFVERSERYVLCDSEIVGELVFGKRNAQVDLALVALNDDVEFLNETMTGQRITRLLGVAPLHVKDELELSGIHNPGKAFVQDLGVGGRIVVKPQEGDALEMENVISASDRHTGGRAPSQAGDSGGLASRGDRVYGLMVSDSTLYTYIQPVAAVVKTLQTVFSSNNIVLL